MRTLNIKIIASILLITIGILFFSLGVQKYQILTSSHAALNLPQCEIPDGETAPSNAPCASCDVSNNSSINAQGAASVAFGCKVVCNDSGDPLDTTGCSTGILPYTVNSTSWYWCRESSDNECTEATPDLLNHKKDTGFTSGGPWLVSKQGDTDFTANFSIPTYENCGRVQVSVNTNQTSSYVLDSGTDCNDTIVAMDGEIPGLPTPTFGFGFPDGTLTPTPRVVNPTLPPPTSTRTPTPSPSLTTSPTLTGTPISTLTPSKSPSLTISPSGSLTPSITVTGTITPSISITLSPSISPTATLTLTPTATPTFTPSPTPTFIPTFTPTPPKSITVDGTPPGGSPWFMMLIPAGLVVLGLLF